MLREDAKEQVSSVIGEELEFEKILEHEKEVEENGSEENAGREICSFLESTPSWQKLVNMAPTCCHCFRPHLCY